MTDLRMGVEPSYVFRFKVGTMSNPHAKPVIPEQIPNRWADGLLKKVWQRIWDPGVAI